ncbi:MAG TPA: sorbosone dehydrogenase family protein [Chitinophagaceae bacterium]|nr:sorbosone dehydrogenase family protein [Chitinophagaceae bacterium]
MKRTFFCLAIATCLISCNNPSASKNQSADSSASASNPVVDTAASLTPDSLPAPFATPSANNYCKVIGWPKEKTPIAPAGFTVTRFADSLDNPRWIYQGPNGDVFVAEANTEVTGVKKIAAKLSAKGKSQKLSKSANVVLLFRDGSKDGVYEQQYLFASNLNRPLGMAIINNKFYIANTDALIQYNYNPGDTVLTGPGKTIVSLPAGGYNNHWTRNIIPSKSGDKLFISVGSGSNVAEHGLANEKRRANILQVAPDGSGEQVYASGLRNPVGMDWEPVSGKLWTAVNERDELGDELVPDYITSVKEGGFYGWPYAYFGQHADPRMKNEPHPELVAKTIVPDVSVGAHTASLGLSFYTGKTFPAQYQGGAFVAQHGSWNKSALAGYKVLFVPFRNGQPSAKPTDFLTGFIANAANNEVYGRPVGVITLQDGSLLIADDAGNTIWRVQAVK